MSGIFSRLLPLAVASVLSAFIVLTGVAACQAQDEVELMSGAKLTGKMGPIRKTEKEFDFSARIGNRSIKRTYQFAQVHAVTINGRRFVLTPKAAASVEGEQGKLSAADVKKLIQKVGSTPPEWYDSAKREHPKSLDLSWPLKPPSKGWNANKNVGQYLWTTVYPNKSRWQGAVRLLHEIAISHKDNPTLLQRDMKTLGSAYFFLFQDYARAAFWLEKAGATVQTRDGISLAECYWRLGNRQMALDMLKARTLHPDAIKLLGDMGETKTALKLAAAAARSQPHQTYLAAGDVCRVAKQYDQAIAFYEKVLSAGRARNADYQKRFEARAKESIEAIRLYEKADVTKVKDGTYTASSTGYNGALEVKVTVNNARISDVAVTRHNEKQFYSALDDTPRKIIDKQSINGIDATSRATITSQAIVNASAKALAKGAR